MPKNPSATLSAIRSDAKGQLPFTKGDSRRAAQLLRAWREKGDEGDHQRTLEALRRGLNRSRLPGCEVLR